MEYRQSLLDKIDELFDYDSTKKKIVFLPVIFLLIWVILSIWLGQKGTTYALTFIPIFFLFFILIDYFINKRSNYDFIRDGIYNVSVHYIIPYLIVISWFYIFPDFLPNSEIKYSNAERISIKAIYAFSIIASTSLQLLFLLRLVNLNRYIKFKVKNFFLLFVLCYLTTGLNFSVLFLLQDGSLKNVKVSHTLIDTIYFSFVTIATTGYGDISPKSDWAKLLVIIENFIGLFLTAYVIAMIFTVKRK